MDVQLSIDEITVTEHELRVAYVLDNREDRDLFVYNLLPDRFAQLGSASDKRIAELAQTCLLRPQTLFMLLGIVPRQIRNPAMTFFAPLMPDCTKVEAGRGYAATLRAKLPLAEWSEYSAPNRDGESVAVTELRLDAQFVFADETDWVEPRADTSGAWVARGKLRRVSTTASLAAYGLAIHDNPELAPFPT